MFLEKLTEHTWGVKKGWPRSLMAKTSSKKMNLAVLNKSYLMIMNKLLLLYYKHNYSNMCIDCCKILY